MELGQYGLIAVEKRVSVPLKKIHVDAIIKGIVCSLTAEFHYVNDEDNPVEAVFVLPLESGLSICDFRAEIDDRVIVGRIEEKEQARQDYDDAISSGQTAFLMEESMDSDDIFKISVGNLPSQKAAKVTFTAVMVLKHLEEGEIQFVLPTILNPRYSPAEGGEKLDNWSQRSASCPSVGCPYTFSLSAKVEAGSKIVDVSSPTHQLSVVKEDTAAKVTVEKLEEFAKDVEIVIKQEHPFQPVAFLEPGNPDSKEGFLASSVIMLNYYPKDILAQQKKTTPGEYVFIIDRSGSMSGSQIKNARESLVLFLKSLPPNSKFNIISFGSRFDFLFHSGSKDYTNATVSEACRAVSSMEADYGGTEILQPLKALFTQPPIRDLQRRVFLITDGEVSNTSAVIDLVRKECASGKSRVFALGIGHGASTSLIEGVAKAGCGMAEFAREGSTIQQKVVTLLRKATYPYISSITLTCPAASPSELKQIPQSVPEVFLGDFLAIYGIYKQPSSSPFPARINLSFSMANGSIQQNLPVRETSKNGDYTVELHHVAARCLVLDMLKHGHSKEDIVCLSKEAGVICKYTAFIALDEANLEPVRGTMMRRDIIQNRRCYARNSPSYFLSDGSDDDSEDECCLMLDGDFAPVNEEMFAEENEDLDSVDMPHNFRSKPDKCTIDSEPVDPGLPYKLISLQSVDGSWPLTSEVATELEINLQVVMQTLPKAIANETAKDTIWTTALVMVWLSHKFHERQMELCLLVDKAEAYLSQWESIISLKELKALSKCALKL